MKPLLTRIFSLDLETYGSCQVDHAGEPLPSQRVSHPIKSLACDGVPLHRQILTCTLTRVLTTDPTALSMKDALTIPKHPAPPVGAGNIAAWEPGTTMTFHLHIPDHRKMLVAWLKHARALVGMNLLFDLLYLSADPQFREHLRHLFFIDLSHLIYLEYDDRPERSLKDIGPIYGTHQYERTLKQGRFTHQRSKKFLEYAALDTHATILACAAAARRIKATYSKTDKLSASSLCFFSAETSLLLRMSEAGLPLSRSYFEKLETTCRVECEKAAKLFSPYLFSGKGCQATQIAFLDSIMKDIDSLGGIPVLEDPLLEFTKTKKKVSFSDNNRKIFKQRLPECHPHQQRLNAWESYAFHSKLLNTYVTPILRWGKPSTSDKFPTFKSSLIRLPHPSSVSSSSLASFLPASYFPGDRPDDDVQFAYPQWYAVPSGYKDDSSDTQGGQKQIRPSAKDPPAQTFSPTIKAGYRSRFSDGLIVVYDLEQAELKSAAVLSGDPYLMEAYNSVPPKDVHRERAIQALGPSVVNNPDFHKGDKRKDPRQWFKQVNFLDLNLGGPHRMRELIMDLCGIDLGLEFCQKIIAARSTQRPGLVKWQNARIDEVRRTGYLEAPFTGHSRMFGQDPSASGMINEVVNFLIQATAAAANLYIQFYLNQVLPIPTQTSPVHLFLNTYDSTSFDCKKSYLPTLDQHYRDAIEWVNSPSGYWGRLCALTGHHVRLTHDRSIKG